MRPLLGAAVLALAVVVTLAAVAILHSHETRTAAKARVASQRDGATSGPSSADSVPPTTVHQPWALSTSQTTCEQWLNVLDKNDRQTLSSILLHNVWRQHGLYFDPEPARIDDFEADVSNECRSMLSYPNYDNNPDNITSVMANVRRDNWMKYLGASP